MVPFSEQDKHAPIENIIMIQKDGKILQIQDILRSMQLTVSMFLSVSSLYWQWSKIYYAKNPIVIEVLIAFI